MAFFSDRHEDLKSYMTKMCLYSKAHIGKHLSDSFLFQNGLKQGDASLLLLFNFALVYANGKVQENQLGLKLNGTCSLLVYADDMNLLGDDLGTTNKNKETLINAGKEVGLKVNTEKIVYMLVSHHQNIGQYRDMKLENKSFENVSQFKYLETTVTNQNFIQEESKTMLVTIQSRTFCLLVCC
jgi:hypothetical protein